MAANQASRFKLFLVMAPVVVFWLFFSELPAFQQAYRKLENIAMDWRFQVRGELETPGVKLVYANVDGATSSYWGERPYPRADFGRLAKVLFDYGEARAVAFDFVFSQGAHSVMVPKETIIDNDKVLALLAQQYPDTVFAAFYSGSLLPLTMEERAIDRNEVELVEKTRDFPYLRPGDYAPSDETFPEMPTFPIVRGPGDANIGLIDMDIERNAGPAQRWVPLFAKAEGPYETLNLVDGVIFALDMGPEEVGDLVQPVGDNIMILDQNFRQVGTPPIITERTFYTMALELALIELGLSEENVSITDEFLTVSRPDGEAVIRVPLTDRQVVETNWFSRWENRELNPAASVRIILEQAYNLEHGEGELVEEAEQFFKQFNAAIVLVGPTDPLLQDLAPTPFDSHAVPKVGVHGNLYKTMMTGQYITRLPEWLNILIFLLVTTCVALPGTYTGRHSLWSKAGGLLLLLTYIVAVFFFFNTQHLVLPLIAPVLCAVTTTTAGAVYQLFVEERQKGRIKGMFGTYISPDLVNQMVDSGEEPQLGGVEESITAFFSDIQSFSSFSEMLEPTQLVELMNEYLTAMTDLLQDEGGTLDKYIGDAMVAMFNAPIHIEHHALKACRAAALIQKRQVELRRKWADEGDKWPEIVAKMQTRIGLNTGHAVVGNMGSEGRFNYTMMGDTVNLAARCESGAKSAGVYTMVTEQTKVEALEASDEIVFRFVDKWQVKGRSQPVNMFELVGFRADLSAEVLECVKRYEAALEKYFAQQWDEAKAAFEAASAMEQFQPGETPGVSTNPSLAMMKRCEEMKADPPQADWDGVYVMKTK